MKDFINNIIPKIRAKSKQLNDESILKNQHWVMLDENGPTSTTYIFRDNNQLLVSINGNVTIGKWEYLTSEKILITLDNNIFLYKNHYFDDKLIALKKDGADIFAVFINESFLNNDLTSANSLEQYLNKTYSLEKPVDEPLNNVIEKEENNNGQETTVATNDKSGNIFIIAFALVFVVLIVYVSFFSDNSNRNTDNNSYENISNNESSEEEIIDSTLISSESSYHSNSVNEAQILKSYTISIGMSKKEVKERLGSPRSIYDYEYNNESTWYYGRSNITFKNGKVKEYSNAGDFIVD